MARCVRLALLGGLSVVIMTTSSVPARAQGLVNEVRWSRWDTRYEAQGRNIRAIVTFAGERGQYTPVNNQGRPTGGGRLSGLKYFDQGPQGVLITGRWAMNGEAGAVQFEVTRDGRAIHGAWNNDAVTRGGAWSGARLADAPPVQPAVEPPYQPPRPPGGARPPRPTGVVVYDPWQFHHEKAYWYRVCRFPAGGYQYLIYYPDYRPNWVYWFNPVNNLFWCACPTSSHPQWGGAIKQGEDLFLVANVKAGSVDQCEFPHPGPRGEFFTRSQAQDKDGSMVPLDCPPEDLP